MGEGMSPFLVLLPAAVVLGASSWLSYQSPARASAWFLPAMTAFSAVNGLLWGLASRAAASDRQLYSVSVAWDVVTLSMYNLLPLLVCGVRLSPTAACGVGLVVLGACLVKWG